MTEPRRADGAVPMRPLVVLTVLAVAAEAILAISFPGSVGGAAGEVVAVVWLVLVARQVVAALRPARRPRSPRADAVSAVAPPLERLRRAVNGGTRVAGDFHLLLRPVLRRVTAGRLRRRGVNLDRDAAAARAFLGYDAYELVRPDREPPEDRFGPAPPPAELERLLDRLEAR